MGVKDGEYLLILKEREQELNELREDIKSGKKEFNETEYDDAFLKIYELRFLHCAVINGADDLIQYEILNLRLKEKERTSY